MHFSIPDTQECIDNNNSSYTVFNIHVNGAYHCSVRYSKFHAFNEQLKKTFGANVIPVFPKKKILSLTAMQLEERRAALEKFIQLLSQNPSIVHSDIFKGFLLSAQQESQREQAEDVSMDVYLMNGHKISVNIKSTDQTEDVQEAVASQIELADDFVYYFGLYLIKKDKDGDNSIVRKLQDFESPYISQKAANKEGEHRVVLRKSYWDPSYDDHLLDDRIAMNLLYVQAVSDIERGWVAATKEQHKQLLSLQHKGSKKEYLRLARTLKFYSFMQFRPCLIDYPEDNCRVLIAAGNRELICQIQVHKGDVKEAVFLVTRMRCWRITSTLDNESPKTNGSKKEAGLEIAFEYLVAKDTLKWITVTSDQAILISLCLQGMVDELLMKKAGGKFKTPHGRSSRTTVQKQSSSSGGGNILKRSRASPPESSSLPSPNKDSSSSVKDSVKDQVKKISDRFTSLSTSDGLTENDAFDGITDDDL